MRTPPKAREATLRERFQSAPWWVLSLTMGCFFGAWMTVFGYLEHPGNWMRAAVIGLIDGVFFGAVMGPLQVRRRRRMVAAIGNMPARDLRVASRAVMRGPVPTDPEIRQAAQWLATNQLKESSRFRWLGLILLVFVTMVSVAIALTSSPWWWLGAVAMFSMFAFFLLMPIHLKRRIEMLKLETSE
jgi:membrane protein YdbS with pleckstrin-like domain